MDPDASSGDTIVPLGVKIGASSKMGESSNSKSLDEYDWEFVYELDLAF